MMRTCFNCLCPNDRSCPMCAECVDCCQCKALAIRASVSRPAYAGQYTDDYRRRAGRMRAAGLALMGLAIVAILFLWKIGVWR